MSELAMTWAQAQRGMSSARKSFLYTLARHASNDGEEKIWASVDTLIAESCVDRKTALRFLRELQDEGALMDTGERYGRTGRIVVYRMTLNGSGGAQANTTTDDEVPDDDAAQWAVEIPVESREQYHYGDHFETCAPRHDPSNTLANSPAIAREMVPLFRPNSPTIPSPLYRLKDSERQRERQSARTRSADSEVFAEPPHTSMVTESPGSEARRFHASIAALQQRRNELVIAYRHLRESEPSERTETYLHGYAATWAAAGIVSGALPTILHEAQKRARERGGNVTIHAFHDTALNLAAANACEVSPVIAEMPSEVTTHD